jgi:anti-anti-sigma regulatory factor
VVSSINPLRGGEWLPGEELRAKALEVCANNTDVLLNVAEIDHLDASALQILLAVDQDRREKGRHVFLENASPQLRQWFRYAGAPDHLFSPPSEKP